MGDWGVDIDGELLGQEQGGSGGGTRGGTRGERERGSWVVSAGRERAGGRGTRGRMEQSVIETERERVRERRWKRKQRRREKLDRAPLTVIIQQRQH